MAGWRWGYALALMLGGCATQPVPEREPVPREIVYVAGSEDPAQRADLLRPEGTGPFPAVVVVHGGGWVRGDRGQMTHIVRRLLAQGYVVLNIDYRLAPQHPYPAAVDDVRAALRWLAAQAGPLQIDPARIYLWGYSAGAHLAALVAATPDAQTPPLAAAIVGGLPADLVRAQNSDLVQQFLGGSIAQQAPRYVEASPLSRISAASAPMLLYHGSWDWIVDPVFSRDMYWRLRAAGVDSELVMQPGRGHIAAFFFDDTAAQRAFAFMAAHRAPS